MRTAEHNAKIGAALRGKPKSAEHRQRLSVARKGQGVGSKNPNWRGGDWYSHPKEKARVYNANSRARKFGTPETLTLTEWLEVLEEYDYRCAYCFAPYEQLDHVIPFPAGGGSEKGNVVPACTDCNKRKVGRKSGWVPSIASKFWPRLAEEMYA